MKRATGFRMLRVLFFGPVVLVFLVVLLLVEENLRGKMAWNHYKREAEAQGVAFELHPFLPAPVPDEQNFAMTPLLRPLFGAKANSYKRVLSQRLELKGIKENEKCPLLSGMRDGKRVDLGVWGEYLGNMDVLAALQKFSPELSEISEASRRPYARFPVQYDRWVEYRSPHVRPLMDLSKLYALRALAELEVGKTDQAHADVLTLFRLAECFGSEPMFTSQLVRVFVLSMATQVVWEGMETHRWSESQLAEIQSFLERVNLFGSTNRAIQFERATLPDALQRLMKEPKKFAPHLGCSALLESKFETACFGYLLKSIQYQNFLAISRYDARLLQMIDPEKRRVDVGKLSKEEARCRSTREKYNPYSMMRRMGLSSMFHLYPRMAHAQTSTDQALVVCALERYRIAHGEFPGELLALIPQYLQKLPHDVINGQPLHYRRTDDGLFALYSVGWNETDENGMVTMNQFDFQDIKRGDWAWRHVSATDR